MNEQTMDRLAKSVAGGFSRRRFLRRASGTVAAGVAAIGLGEQARWAKALSRADPEEQSVLLFEQLAEIVDEHATSCDDLSTKVLAFQKANQDLLTRIRTEQAKWSEDQRRTHAKTYSDRRWAAAKTIQAAATRCQYSAKTARKRRAKGQTRPATPGAATPNSAAAPELIPFAAELTALPAAQSTPQSCPYTLTVECIKPSVWTSPETWTVPGSCTSPVDCTICGESDATCAQKYPDDCVVNGTNQCNLAWITNTSCNYSLTAECGNQTTGWTSPETWTMLASCTTPTNCTFCGDTSSVCADRYPAECGGSNSGQCQLDWLADTACTYAIQELCTSSSLQWASATWDAYGSCNSDQSQCTPCDGNDVCAAKFPAQCVVNGINQCVMAWEKPAASASCCQKNCPQSTGDCVGNGIGTFAGDGSCSACMLSWCGSDQKCLEYCQDEDCCDEACSEDYVPPPPAGEGKTTGTPIPAQGTPAVSTPPPTTPATATPTAPPIAPPTVSPTPPPATVPPTASPGSPTAAPPPATGTTTS